MAMEVDLDVLKVIGGEKRHDERGLLVLQNRRCFPMLVCGDVSECG